MRDGGAINNTDRREQLGELAAAAREVFGEDVYDWFHEDDEENIPASDSKRIPVVPASTVARRPYNLFQQTATPGDPEPVQDALCRT